LAKHPHRKATDFLGLAKAYPTDPFISLNCYYALLESEPLKKEKKHVGKEEFYRDPQKDNIEYKVFNYKQVEVLLTTASDKKFHWKTKRGEINVLSAAYPFISTTEPCKEMQLNLSYNDFPLSFQQIRRSKGNFEADPASQVKMIFSNQDVGGCDESSYVIKRFKEEPEELGKIKFEDAFNKQYLPDELFLVEDFNSEEKNLIEFDCSPERYISINKKF